METRLASMDAAAARRIPVGGDDKDSSETINGKRERARVEGEMESDTSTQSLGKRCRVGDLHVASVSDKDVVGGMPNSGTLL